MCAPQEVRGMQKQIYKQKMIDHEQKKTESKQRGKLDTCTEEKSDSRQTVNRQKRQHFNNDYKNKHLQQRNEDTLPRYYNHREWGKTVSNEE